MTRSRRNKKRRLHCEQLEARMVLSGFTDTEPSYGPAPEEGPFQAVIVAGASPDSPTVRIDGNTTTSSFAGVGSLTIATKRGNYICTGTPIDATHVVTAGHCVDLNGDGKSDLRDGIKSITFNLNYGASYTSRITANSWVTHPDFTGFNRPSIHDDIAVLTLSESIPSTVPLYGLFTGNLSGQTITLVGYGQSGDGINGYTVNASYTVKRAGQNVVDAFYSQDDSNRTTTNEVFRFDFDRDDGTSGPMGGKSLGNLVETTLGGGDSGGPSFVNVSGTWLLAGVNTFSQSYGTISAPKFGSLGGGMSIPAYAPWINQVITGAAAPASGGTGNGNGTHGAANVEVIRWHMNDPIAVPNEWPALKAGLKTSLMPMAVVVNTISSQGSLPQNALNVVQTPMHRRSEELAAGENRATRKKTTNPQATSSDSSSLDVEPLDAVDTVFAGW